MKKLLLTIALLFTLASHAQEKVSLSLHQDSRLMFTGDDHGNKAGTINIMARFKMQGCQFRFGYLVIYPEFEYADLKIPFKRYSANIGWTFNNLGILQDRLEYSAFANFGMIQRDAASYSSLGASMEVAFRLGYRYKISWVGQYSQRRDFALYNLKTKYRYSGFLGLEVNLN